MKKQLTVLASILFMAFALIVSFTPATRIVKANPGSECGDCMRAAAEHGKQCRSSPSPEACQDKTENMRQNCRLFVCGKGTDGGGEECDPTIEECPVEPTE